MRCCAELLVLLVAWPLAAQAPERDGLVATAPSQQEAVARNVAKHWHVDPATVRIESAVPDPWPSADTPFTLMGDGAGGIWIVATEDSAGPRRRTVRAGTMQRVARATRVLERGVALSEADFAFDLEVQWGPPRPAEAGVAAGWVTRRRINAGETLRSPLVEAPRAVKSGETVRIILERGSITLVLTGKAIGSAALGERLQVRAETGKRLEGIVVGPGVVRLEHTGANR